MNKYSYPVPTFISTLASIFIDALISGKIKEVFSLFLDVSAKAGVKLSEGLAPYSIHKNIE